MCRTQSCTVDKQRPESPCPAAHGRGGSWDREVAWPRARAEVLGVASSVHHHFREGPSGFPRGWRRKGSPELLILQFFCSCISSLLPPSPLASPAVSSPS